ncbi:non-ribosomal peptide synthetase [Dyella tabacisoli]|uniref:Amino acid adenylation domain-containing protein n=1 Tax=Dyella tabacisoli TaxID=2282381 RepID=A0A369UPB1_9GAMM|nr:non-ribosomal peptide synthetase [Dyella tabacisoli]RDD80169.1 amino acid adenylation domain-containing protein [Dyella tabacisoli]
MLFEDLSKSLSQTVDIHLLSSPQLDIYHDQLMKGDAPTYNLGGYLDFSGALDIVNFERALNLVVKMHDSLRIILVERGDDVPGQYMAQEVPVSMAFLDFSGRVAAHDDATAWMHEHINIPFQLIGRPLFRCALIKLGDDRFYWFLCTHHLVADGWSVDLISQSLANIYSALERKDASDPNAPSYAGFLESDRKYLKSKQFDQDKAYWLNTYGDVPEPLLSPRHQGHFTSQTASGERSWHLSRDFDEKINALAAEHQSTRFQVMLGLFYAFFLRLEQRDELVIGMSVLNRKDAASRKTSGMFTNVMPMRLRFDKGGSFVDLLGAITPALRQDYRHQRFPIGELNKALELFKSHRSHIYDLSMSYEHGGDALLFGSTPAFAVKCTNDHESTPLRLCIRDNLHRQETTMHLIFSRSYFNDEEVGGLEDRFTQFMDELLSNPRSPLDSLPIVTVAEMRQFASWNASSVAFPNNICTHELFQQQVAHRPHAVAVVYGGESLTYAGLNAQANCLAHHLIAFGVRPDDRVALCVERSLAMIVGLLAILKAGGAYVPLDPSYPAERLTYVLKDAQPLLVLTDASGRRVLGARPAELVTLDLDDASPPWAARSIHNPSIHNPSSHNPEVVGLTSRHLAYVIYTSGSTGQPKGVMVEHRNICHQVAALQRAYRLHAEDRLLQFASLAFDMSVEDIFSALLTGATLVLRTDQCLSSPAAFAAFCVEHQLTSLNLPSTFWAQLALAQPELELPLSLRQVISGGDAMSLSAISAWLGRSGHRPQLFNAYGPTEATVNATLLHVEQALHVSSIGRPLSNTQAYLLDGGGQPVPLGAVGELYVGGAGVARGYFNRPQLTAERFPVDPFSSIPGARMYRTGDLARYLPDGNIEFLGRNDNQVKIRGFRIELGEIEARLADHPAVSEAVVLAVGEGHDKRLVAYVVAQPQAVDPSSLVGTWRAHLAAELPEYMVPAAFVRLDAFPLTLNGKLDRKALPDPDDQAFAHRAYEPPHGEIEIALAALWRELLGVERIGRHDHFFELGGHSLIAIRLLGRVGQIFDTTLPLVRLFNYPTLAGLAGAIVARRKDGRRYPELPPILPVARVETVPLSYAQQRLWFMAQLDNASATYHISLVLHLDGALDSHVLRRSLDRLLARHEALRTVFLSIDGDPRAALLPANTPFPLAEYDLRGVLDADALLARYTDEYAHGPFDLERGPLIRAGLVRLSDRRHTLLLSMHHIVADGWSINLLAREVSALYVAYSQLRADPLPPLPVQYPDYAGWQRSALTSERLQGQVDYWRDALRGVPDLLGLPTDRPRPPRQSFAGAVLPLRIDPLLTGNLKHLCRQLGVSLFMLLTAAWASVLARLSGQDDVLIGTLSANRGQREIEPLIGFFVSTLALRLDVSGEPDTGELLIRVRQTILAAQENQDLPFEQVVEIARPSRRLDHSPLFQVLFAWQSNDKSSFDLPGIEVRQADMSLDWIRYDLELHLYEKDDVVVGGLGYSTALFDQASIERHGGYLMTMLNAMVANPRLSLKQVSLPGPGEQALLDRWKDTGAAYPQESCVHRLFERQVARSPQAIALIYGEQRLSYAQLNAQANQWARHLRALGIGADRCADQRVALCAERGFDMVAGLLAILKAGACYVPLDPSYPSERLRQILAEADAELVLGDAAGRDAIGAQVLAQHRVLELDALARRCSELAQDDLASPHEPSPDDLAYVIYTSGSTGTPKGVAMPHRPLSNLVHWQQQEAERSGVPAPRTLQFAALGFDVAFQEIFSSLCIGASLVLVDGQTRLQFDKLIEVLHRQRVQRVFLPYIALQTLAETVDDAPGDDVGLLPDLRDVIVAGEQLRLTAQIQRLFKRLPACRLHNHYGPTETHVVTAQTLTPEAIAESPSHVPIGRPIANSRAYLLDRYGLHVPLGAIGELHIGGIGIARGYLGRPGLTAQRFLSDPFAAHSGARMYRTGDLARYLPDGRLVFVGRNDHQVKVRGFRIELGEIEARLAEHPSVRECAVVARNDARGDMSLVAYVVPLGCSNGLAATLHAHLGNVLPAYMVPAAFVVLDSIPLTAHGKLDRDVLPAPTEQAFARALYEPPQGRVETELAGLWQTLLGLTQVSRHDHFFELGGHSLIAVRLLSRISHAFGVVLPLVTLFAQPVLRDLAKVLAERLAQASESAYATIPPVPREKRLPLSYAQQRLWFLAQLDGESATYHIPLTVRLDGALDVGAMRSALNSLFARHESLRTVFIAEHGQPHAELLAVDAGLMLREHDLSRQPDVEAAQRRLLAEERNRPFDLAGGPLIRASLVRLDECRHVFLLTLHHIVADGWSLGILARELGTCYAASIRSHEHSLPPLPIQYADYVDWERKWLTGEYLAGQAAYWRGQLAGAPALLELPTDRPRPVRQSFVGAFLPLTIDRTLTRDLKRLGQRHGVTLFMMVLAAWAVVLSRLAGQQDVLIGTPAAGRGRQELEPLIGFFVNTLALRIDLTARHDTASLLALVRQLALDAQAQQELPFEQVVDIARVPRRIDRTPLVQVLFAWQSHDEGKLELPGILVEPILGEFDWVKFDLELILNEVDGTIQGGLNYASELFDRETINRHAGYLQNVLAAMVADDSRPISQIPMLSTAEQQMLLENWNRTETPYSDQLCMHELVERWAREAPQATALVGEEGRLSYAQLNAQANRLAHYLIGLGVRPDQRIALCVEKGLAMFVGLLGILKAGAAYVPLDPAYASARLDHILCDAAPNLLLCDDSGRAALGAAVLASVDVLDLADASAWIDSPADDPKIAGLSSRHLAYIIYTSGSTGTPKGVMVEHHGVINLALSLVDRLGVTARSRVSQFASLGFDASVFESAMAFAAGAALYLPSVVERQSPSAFIAFIGRCQITHATVPPAFLQGVAETPQWTHRPVLILAGEAPSPGLLKAWIRHATLANAYGPTEITVCASVWVCPDDSKPDAPRPDDPRPDSPSELLSVPIGRPLANTRMYLLDEHGLPVPRGSIGELYIGGVGVSRGYLNRAELTAERFLPDPFDGRADARMYRSGDLARYLPDGNLVFLGRNDHQVKLRGFRIELGEIEAHLATHPAVRENAVLAREDRPGDARLVAYVVADRADADHADDDLAATLRDYLGTRLPEYMIPAAFVALACLPLTANGKVDRKALPAPDEQALVRRAYEPPYGKTEIALAALWRELLGVERIGRHDHFFELGGHSLLVVQLAARMREIFERAVAVHEMFRYPVLKDMANLLLATVEPVMPPTLDLSAEIVLDEAIRASAPVQYRARPQHILLTGATGFLGAFLLSSLLKRTRATVHCLIRCTDAVEGRFKLDANMRLLGLTDYDRARVAVIPGDFSRPLLGLSEDQFNHLAHLIEVIYHNGAWVNSLHTYASLKAANVLGTQEVLRLAAKGTPKHIHHISTLSTIPAVESAGAEITTEAQLTEHWPGLASGYAQSKWVAERLLRIGGERGIPFTIYRPTHIGGASSSGASNASDTWSLFMDACLILERVPMLETSINSLPVDYMGDCIVELSLREGMHGKSLNLANPQSFMLSELTRQIAAVEPAVERIDYRQWRRLCSEHPATRRLASVMPAELSVPSTAEAAPARIDLSNAVIELSREGMPYPSMTADLLRKYVVWRHRLCVQPA